MAAQEKWYFTRPQLQNSPSRKCGLDADKELAYRQQAANLIQDMGQRLQVSQLCINTAIVYMHRFYAFHSFTHFHRNSIAAAALFLAAKVEEQPRKLEYVIKVAHVCLHRGEGANSLKEEQYLEQAQDLVFNENVLLQTLGFDVAIDHPHTHVVRTCHLVKAPKDLAQTSYFMASNSLHLTTMCLQYKPTVVACFCIHLASKWSNWAIPQSNEGRHWFQYVDKSVTQELLECLTAEFLHIFDKCPSRLKRKMTALSNTPTGGSPHSGAHGQIASSPFDKKHNMDEIDKSFDKEYERERRRPPIPGGYVPASNAAQPSTSQPATNKIDYNAYREKREREERERRDERRQQAAAVGMATAAQPRPVPPAAQTGRPPGQPPAPPHHQRPPSQHHHKPHHPWPHKPSSHHKPPHDHRHHRPPTERPERLDRPPAERPERPPERTERQNVPPVIPHPQLPQPEIVPQRTRPPSLFSPENSTTPQAAAAAAPRRPQLPPQRTRPEHREQKPPPPTIPPISIPQERQERPEKVERPPSPKKRPEVTTAVKDMQPPPILSPFNSPPFKDGKDIKPRVRLQSSSSEPELVPVVKKLEETAGYENVIRDSQRGNTIKARMPEKKPEMPPLASRSLNGIETDPTLVSNLLKESLAKPAPITVVTERKSPEIKREPIPPPQPIVPPSVQEPTPALPNAAEEPTKHKKEKKKKEKHKHKDRDKSKEERKKHKKDKKRESSPVAEDGLKITIPRDKLESPGLKIKIPKERLTTATIPPPPQTSGLKIKISKEVLETSRKRGGPGDAGPPPKMSRQNGAPHKVVDGYGNGHASK